MKKYLAIDLGGTNVRVAIVNDEGEVLDARKAPSLTNDTAENILNRIYSLSNELDGIKEIVSVGMGLPGPIDQKAGTITLGTNVSSFTNYPLRDHLENYFECPAYIENDANVAGLAEARFGAGKDKQIVYYITHSTVIGGALVIDNKIISGSKGYAGEVGNIMIDRNRPSYPEHNTLVNGAIENEASGLALIRKVKEEMDLEINSAEHLFALAKNGDQTAKRIIDEMSYDMAVMLQAIAHIIDPDIFVFGGGVSLSSKQYWPQMIKHYNKLVHDELREVEFKVAELREPGLIGAAALCMMDGDV